MATSPIFGAQVESSLRQVNSSRLAENIQILAKCPKCANIHVYDEIYAYCMTQCTYIFDNGEKTLFIKIFGDHCSKCSLVGLTFVP